MVKANDTIAIIIALFLTITIVGSTLACRTVTDTDTEKGTTSDDHGGGPGDAEASIGQQSQPVQVIRVPQQPAQGSSVRAPGNVVGDRGVVVPGRVGQDGGVRVVRHPQTAQVTV
ncbi:hypothetical protein TSTA_057310 [Talaromyces stipitatus ATCC 10500]|uniref:Secreted protein n=1 Tax=Talaromyces stipitatus (strain ATCC 10500 / CBS 375.48 / QM 6759 / NRRL 1006) TaxID=441959 RepID=B8MQ93_TALSN|nr:uncharacterized protein TSTA_057310 [Talaromyces stipitatus ATCC 10500]EED13240.1 hypothetical protein TSTA_057310 [Talaromyces stipitatus ATCC 10500]